MPRAITKRSSAPRPTRLLSAVRRLTMRRLRPSSSRPPGTCPIRRRCRSCCTRKRVSLDRPGPPDAIRRWKLWDCSKRRSPTRPTNGGPRSLRSSSFASTGATVRPGRLRANRIWRCSRPSQTPKWLKARAPKPRNSTAGPSWSRSISSHRGPLRSSPRASAPMRWSPSKPNSNRCKPGSRRTPRMQPPVRS